MSRSYIFPFVARMAVAGQLLSGDMPAHDTEIGSRQNFFIHSFSCGS
jgi:hypothetical protein